jgi:hypothetical protein
VVNYGRNLVTMSIAWTRPPSVEICLRVLHTFLPFLIPAVFFPSGQKVHRREVVD